MTSLIRTSSILAIACAFSCAAQAPTMSEMSSTTGIVGPFEPSRWPDLPDADTSTGAQVPEKIWGGSTTTSDPEPLPDPGLSWLLVSEVHSNPEGKDGGPNAPEFVEVVHTGNEPISLAGLQIEARSWPTLTSQLLGVSELTLDPGQTLVVERYESSALPDPSLTVDESTGVRVAFASSAGLRNADGAVLLRAVGSDSAIDVVTYGGPQPAPFDDPEAFVLPAAEAPANGMSICRAPADLDTNTAADWVACAPSPGSVSTEDSEGSDTEGSDTEGSDTGAPDTEGSDTEADTEDSEGQDDVIQPPAIVIREVLSNAPGPSAEEKLYEFVELLNISESEVDLEDWWISDSLQDNAPGTDPLLYAGGDGGCESPTCLAPGHLALVVGNAYVGPTGDALVLFTDDSTLADGGLTSLEPVRLLDPNGEPHSTYRQWEDPGVEPNPIHVEQALVRQPDAPDAPGSWEFAEPTPGS